MKSFLKKLFNIHENIGKVFTTTTIAIVISICIGIVFNKIKINNYDDVVKTNFFLNEQIPLHNDNYTIIVHNVKNEEKIQVKDKNNNYQEVNGNIIAITISIYQNETSKLSSHKIDTNDFKLKNHTGVYVPLNSIMGAVGWDAIDLHIDEKNNGHVMSSTSFDTTNCYKDYTYINESISKGETLNFTVYFKMDSFINIEKELTVLEIDFYTSSIDYRKGVDIILLERPANL